MLRRYFYLRNVRKYLRKAQTLGITTLQQILRRYGDVLFKGK